MIHQPLGGDQGQETDMAIRVRRLLENKEALIKMYCEYCSQDEATMRNALERDNFMTAIMAKEFGLIDEVIEKMQ